MKDILFIVVVIAVLFLINKTLGLFETFDPSLTFSNTQTLGVSFRMTANRMNKELETIMKSIPKPPFPKNDSRQTRQELDEILQKQTQLTDERIAQIKREAPSDTLFTDMGATTEEAIKLDRFLHNIANPIIMSLKLKFNRVRPEFLEKRIRKVIETPTHPAYPSGHATQSYIVAYLLSEKYPHRKNELMKIADRIAQNREYAGVHYRSDSEYGKLIAQHLTRTFKGKVKI